MRQKAKDIAMFYSFFATCTKNDIDPQKWLTYVIQNINDTEESELKNLLPQFIDKKSTGLGFNWWAGYDHQLTIAIKKIGYEIRNYMDEQSVPDKFTVLLYVFLPRN